MRVPPRRKHRALHIVWVSGWPAAAGGTWDKVQRMLCIKVLTGSSLVRVRCELDGPILSLKLRLQLWPRSVACAFSRAAANSTLILVRGSSWRATTWTLTRTVRLGIAKKDMRTDPKLRAMSLIGHRRGRLDRSLHRSADHRGSLSPCP